MPTFDKDIPQAGDDPSVSQGQLLQNFTTLDSVYGTSGDHYAWSNTNSAETARHAKVTMPGLPTDNAPGAIVPTPNADDGVMFALKTDKTRPFWRSNSNTTNFPMTPLWAFGEAFIPDPIAAPTITLGYLNLNPATPIQRTGIGIYKFNFSIPLLDTNYVAICSMGYRSGKGAQPIIAIGSKFIDAVEVVLRRQDGANYTDGGGSVEFISVSVFINKG